MTLFRMISPDRDSILQRFIDRTKPEDKDAEALIRWGGPSDFGVGENGSLRPVQSIIVNYPNGSGFEDEEEEEEEKEEKRRRRYKEISRKTKRVRVENPDDEDQYVIVEDAVESLMQAQDTGEEFVFEWKDFGGEEV